MTGLDQWSLQLTTSVGADALALTRLEGEEELSGPFLFELSLTATADSIDVKALLGQPAHVTLVDGSGNKRFIHGIVTRFVQNGRECRAELRPWFWLLTLTTDSRIFQTRTVPDILTQLFTDLGQPDHRNDLALTYPKLDYCVQYQETAFDFASRLMEEFGITYYFEHTDAAHTLVLVDDPAKYPPCPNADKVPFLPLPTDRDWLADIRIDTAELAQTLAPVAYQADDYNFITPATELKVTAGQGAWQVYEYPGRYTLRNDGETAAKRRMEEIEAPAKLLSGTSAVRHFRPGATFTMTGHPDAAFNAKYALRSVRHTAARREYSNHFVAFPADVPFRPPRRTPMPRIAGSQTAVVTGSSGKEIWTDQYGRVKVQFHWDQRGKKDENSSCWLRVVQNWAGVSWGAFTLPRIGQEVVVTFLDGDPDRPLITGCIYNGDNPVPYALPDEQTKTTLKSNSSEGGGGFNEIRFEDKKYSEEIFVQAQKDMKVHVLNDRTDTIDHDVTVTVKNNRSVTISEGKESLTVSKGDRVIAVDAGKETHTVKGTRALTVSDAETRTNQADFTHKVTGAYTLNVGGDLTIKASGAVTLQAGTSLTLKAGTELTMQSGTALSLKGGTTMELKGLATGTVDGGGILNLKGGLVKLN